MQTSIFLAKLIGPFFLIVGAGLLLNQAQFRALAEEFMRSPALVFLTGLIALPAGLAIVLTHNVWVANWPVLITILGWLTVFKGAIRLLAPQQTLNVGRTVLAKPHVITISAAIWLVIGTVLTYFGYFR
jgi:hypothetical protein